MLCEICHEREAIINLTEISSEGRRETHLCQTCAAKKSGGAGAFVSLTNPSFISNLLSGMFAKKEEDQPEDDTVLKKTNLVCEFCGMTYNELVKYGKFGCADCYKTFNFLLDGYLKKIQGNPEHVGKKPLHSDETITIPAIGDEEQNPEMNDEKIRITVDQGSSEEELKAALKRAIMREEYEEAAKIRDMIRAGKEVQAYD